MAQSETAVQSAWTVMASNKWTSCMIIVTKCKCYHCHQQHVCFGLSHIVVCDWCLCFVTVLNCYCRKWEFPHGEFGLLVSSQFSSPQFKIVFMHSGKPRWYLCTQKSPDCIYALRKAQMVFMYSGKPRLYLCTQESPDGIYVLRKAQMVFMHSGKPRWYLCTQKSPCMLHLVSSSPSVAFEMLPMFVWVMMALLSCFQGIFSSCHWAFSIKAGSSNRIKLYLVLFNPSIGRTSTEFCQDNVKYRGDL